MTKPTVLLHKFRVPLFKAKVWIIVGNRMDTIIDFAEDKTSEKIIKEENKNTIRAYTYASENDAGARRYMLFIKYTAKPGEIAHEVKHLINILFLWHGHKLSASNDEIECYYLEDIVNKVHNITNRYKKIHKKSKQKRLGEISLNAILS